MATPVLSLTFRGVEIREETIDFARRCLLHMQEQLGLDDVLAQVALMREDGSNVVRALVAVDEHSAQGADPDERLALSNAYAALHERLRTPTSSVA